VIRSRTVLTLAAVGATLAASALGSAHAAAVSAFHAANQTSTSTELTLITGERVLETQDAAGQTRFTVASQGAAVFMDAFGTTRYFVDADALPFMGSELDPSLFDTASSSGSFAVTVAWHGAAAPAMPWLVGARTVAPGVTDGTITASSSSAFRAALAAAGGTWSGALAGIDRISLAGATAPVRQSPDFVQYTLTINGINAAGHPDTGDSVNVLNTDNAEKFNGFGFWNKGIIKLSVPTGHYSLFGTFFATSKSGAAVLDLVVINTVVKGNTTVTVDARAATSRVSVTTPLPTDSGSGNVVWQRTDADALGGASAGVSWSIGGGQPPFNVFVSPTPAPKVGTQAWDVSYHLDSAPAAPQVYTYDLNFGSQGAIAARQRYTVTSSQLASVTTAYYSDVENRASGESRLGLFAWQNFAVGSFDMFAAPEQRTEYVMAQPDLLWEQTVVEDFNDFAGFVQDSNLVFTGGEHTTANWGRTPSGPGVQVDTGAAFGEQLCPVCLEDNTLEFLIYPFGDNPPGHVGEPNTGAPGVTETDTTTLTRNGVTIASGTDPAGAIPVPAGAGHYSLSYDVAMSAPWWTLSTATSTIWDFSTPHALAGTPPPGWLCFSGMATGCNVVGLMFPDYELPLSLLNTTAAGPVSFHLGIDHVLGAAIAVTGATVSVSFDGGTSWHAASVSASGGGFTVGYTVPSSAHTVSLQIHVTDADGGVLDQTIINAYGVS
jgi:hypothetical protein